MSLPTSPGLWWNAVTTSSRQTARLPQPATTARDAARPGWSAGTGRRSRAVPGGGRQQQGARARRRRAGRGLCAAWPDCATGTAADDSATTAAAASGSAQQAARTSRSRGRQQAGRAQQQPSRHTAPPASRHSAATPASAAAVRAAATSGSAPAGPGSPAGARRAARAASPSSAAPRGRPRPATPGRSRSAAVVQAHDEPAAAARQHPGLLPAVDRDRRELPAAGLGVPAGARRLRHDEQGSRATATPRTERCTWPQVRPCAGLGGRRGRGACERPQHEAAGPGTRRCWSPAPGAALAERHGLRRPCRRADRRGRAAADGRRPCRRPACRSAGRRRRPTARSRTPTPVGVVRQRRRGRRRHVGQAHLGDAHRQPASPAQAAAARRGAQPAARGR